MSVQSAYIHIPFCRRRCFYCDFPVKVMGDRAMGTHSPTIADYINVLCTEILKTPNFGDPLKTIFFGGGTPSLLAPQQVETVLATLDRHIGITPDAEISMEMDPGTFDLQQLQAYVSAGINRVSLGIQAFQDALLIRLGRTHKRVDIEQAVNLLHQAHVQNYSFDLISGLPDQTLADWQESLQAAIALNPVHLSCYDLILEPGTPFDRQSQKGILPLPPDNLAADMYRLAQNILTLEGFEHYEISNYARPGYQCRHNRVYWEQGSFYGFGMGAASYLNRDRFTRPRTTTTYRQWVEQDAQDYFSAMPLIPVQASVPESQEALAETLMLGLRLAEGLEWQALSAQFGDQSLDPLWPSIQDFQQQGWIKIQPVTTQPQGIATPTPLPPDSPPKTRIQLSDPEGFLFSNTILSTFFSQLDCID